MTKIKDVLAAQGQNVDHSGVAFLVGKNKTLHGIMDRLKIMQDKDPKMFGLFTKEFNAKDLKGLAGEILEYYQNHSEKVDRFKDAMEYNPN